MQNIEINFGVRPCIVTQNGEEKKALFHMWNNFAKPVAADVYAGGCPEGQISIVFGIVGNTRMAAWMRCAQPKFDLLTIKSKAMLLRRADSW